jgi:signal transduction histidine kinase
VAYVLVGTLAGTGYAVANTLFDVWDRAGSISYVFVRVHGFVDRGIPVLAGALLGIALHYLRLRSELAATEASRAEELDNRLQKVERDQAAWVIATSTLHEVRNPLHSLGLLLDEVVALDAVEPTGSVGGAGQRELLERARAQMGRIEASILSLRRLAASKRPRLTEVDLAEVVSQAVGEARARIPKADGVSLSLVAPQRPKVQGDATFLRIIVENLLQNALDAQRAAATPEPRVRVEILRQDGQAVVRVADNGPGVAPSDRQSVFEPLATTKVQGLGLGLGLSISRALARAMQGEVAFADLEGWSTCLELRLGVLP